MLNPSTADADQDDPTIRRCIGFTETWGHRRLEVVNLFALRSTDPNELMRSSDPVGLENDNYIKRALVNADVVVAAWGEHGALMSRSSTVMKTISNYGVRITVLGLNQSGEPRHPLYIPASTRPKTLIDAANMLG